MDLKRAKLWLCIAGFITLCYFLLYSKGTVNELVQGRNVADYQNIHSIYLTKIYLKEVEKILLQNIRLNNSLSKQKPTEMNRDSVFKKISWENKPDWLPSKFSSDTIFHNCEVKKCKLESKISHSDLVIIYMVNYMNPISQIPRKPNQIFVAFGWESPYHTYSNILLWKDEINWTMTYRMDSTIPLPYGKISKRSVAHDFDSVKLRHKTKLVAWVVSNCSHDPAGRLAYVKILQKYIPVDIYGKCGSLNTERDIFSRIEKEYKFYLAFENSLCQDYITEKFFERQNLNLVLIVRGGGNYTQFFPKNTFIDTRDFASPLTLANYIKYLDKNDTSYLNYLKNKSRLYTSHDRFELLQDGLCEICKKLHEPLEYHVYPNISAWWLKDKCVSPSDLIK